MDEDTAILLAAKVFGAWPEAAVGVATTEVWVEFFMEHFAYEGAAREAVDRLIAEETRRPSLALVKEEYMRHRDKYLPRGLPEPSISDEERREVAARARELVDRLTRRLDAERDAQRQERAAAGLERTADVLRQTQDPNWRDDPSWKLVEWHQELLGRRKKSEKPTKDAELAGDGRWSSIFKGQRLAATWRRG